MTDPLRTQRSFLSATAGLFVLVVLLTVLAAPGEAGYYDPALRWSTLETEHFSIHYHDGEEALAAETAGIAETVHDELSVLFDWSPRSKTQIVLVDATDDANGSATPIPYNTMRLYVSAPGPDSTLDHYDHWLRTLILHEYTHILQLDMVGGLPGVLRKIFGRVITPNALQPQWMIEGLATFEETRGTTAGRGRSSVTDMILRAAVLEDRFPAIDQAGGGLRSWPGSKVAYLFGADFHRFVVEQYGKKVWTDVARRYSRSLVPLFVNTNAREVMGKGYAELWAEWREALRRKYEEQVRRIREAPLTERTPLTTIEGWRQSPRFSPDGRSILYTEHLDHEFPSVKRVGVDGAVEGEVLLHDREAEDFAWLPDGTGAIFAETKTYETWSDYSDLYRVDLGGKGGVTRLTRGARAREPDLAPDGRSVVCVRNALGQTNLWTYDLETATFQALTDAADKTQYAEPRWSPDGTLVAASVKPPGGDREIVVFDRDGTERFRVPAGRGQDRSPCWSPDGSRLYFTSDRTGVANIYAYGPADGSLRRITNLIGGAFEPDVSPDGRTIAFLAYSAGGLQVHLTEAVPGRPVDTAPEPSAPIAPIEATSQTTVQEDHRYSPIPTLLPPRSIMPSLFLNTEEAIFGVSTGGTDVLGEHTYWGGVTYATGSEHLGWSAGYENNQLGTGIALSVYDRSVPFGEIVLDAQGNNREYYEERLTAALTVSLYRTRTKKSYKSLSLGYRLEDRSSLTDFEPLLFLAPDDTYYTLDDFGRIFGRDSDGLDSVAEVLAALPRTWQAFQINVPNRGLFSGLRLEGVYDSRKRTRLAVSPEKGRLVALAGEVYHDGLMSDYDIYIATADWREYLRVPIPHPFFHHHVLALRLAGGLAEGDVLYQRTFRLGGSFGESMLYGRSDKYYILRGYPTNWFLGQRVVLGSAEYRFPIWAMERGIDTLPIFFNQLHGALFADYGDAFDKGFEPDRLKLGLGAELRFSVTLLYWLPITGRLGYAWGKDDEGLSEVYVGLGTSF